MNKSWIAVVGLAALTAFAVAQRASETQLVGKPAPSFTAQATDGKTHNLKDLAAKGPVFLVFWKDPCPHNPLAASLINEIVKSYGNRIQFLGVVNGTVESSKKFKDQFKKPYELLADADKKIIGDYAMRRSIAFVEVGKDGNVQQTFGGYGAESLGELNKALAKAAGVAEAKVDLSQAPARTVYG
jgi:peroxiredoxin